MRNFIAILVLVATFTACKQGEGEKVSGNPAPPGSLSGDAGKTPPVPDKNNPTTNGGLGTGGSKGSGTGLPQ
jgi:hypothetical protein